MLIADGMRKNNICLSIVISLVCILIHIDFIYAWRSKFHHHCKILFAYIYMCCVVRVFHTCLYLMLNILFSRFLINRKGDTFTMLISKLKGEDAGEISCKIGDRYSKCILTVEESECLHHLISPFV